MKSGDHGIVCFFSLSLMTLTDTGIVNFQSDGIEMVPDLKFPLYCMTDFVFLQLCSEKQEMC